MALVQQIQLQREAGARDRARRLTGSPALRVVGRYRVDRNRAIEQLRARLMAGVMWAIQIIESIKATGSEADLLVRWTGDQARMINAEQELGGCDALLIALPPLLSSVTTILVLGLGGRQVMIGTISIGALVAFQSLLVGFNKPFRDLAQGHGSRAHAVADNRQHHRLGGRMERAYFVGVFRLPGASLRGPGTGHVA